MGYIGSNQVPRLNGPVTLGCLFLVSLDFQGIHVQWLLHCLRPYGLASAWNTGACKYVCTRDWIMPSVSLIFWRKSLFFFWAYVKSGKKNLENLWHALFLSRDLHLKKKVTRFTLFFKKMRNLCFFCYATYAPQKRGLHLFLRDVHQNKPRITPLLKKKRFTVLKQIRDVRHKTKKTLTCSEALGTPQTVAVMEHIWPLAGHY